MKLSDIIFTDGQILSYEYHRGTVRITFVHYTDDRLAIELTGCESIEERGSVDISVADSRIRKTNGKKELSLYDDDGLVFRAVFEDAVVTPLD